MSLTERIKQARELMERSRDEEAILLEETKVIGVIQVLRHIDLKGLVAHPDFPWGDDKLAIAVPLLLRLQELARGAK